MRSERIRTAIVKILAILAGVVGCAAVIILAALSKIGVI